ncbi:phosphatase 2C-like domain-containing protein, partial [Fimicolochytrium jonesii]|uniref:phosphatase 2C-like domain-containing protein n=1 Tax=Fimicolochytrium jonesii TaxID=1396493 RepID=UPI0022FE550D
ENDAASQSAESPASSHHLITWAVSTEKGYRNTFGGNRLSIHPEMEDVHWPVHGTTPPAKQSPPSTPNGDRSSSRRAGEILADGSQLFVLADGHGGVEAPRFFVAGAVESVGAIWNERSWDLEDMDQRGEFRAQVHQAFKVLDATYASQKVEEYRRWMDARKDTNGGDDADLPSKAGKPVDDGCTLVVNIITKGWVININVGDSRTVVGMKADADHGSTWDPVFESSDHNMTHPAKIHHIQRTGGQFIYPYGTLRTIELCAADGKPITAETKIPTTPYTQLEGMRIYRPPSAQIRAVGVSHRRTLNLSATMGDLLFKVEPAVLSCVPDVEFVKLRSDRPYILVAATDGVWDHMRVQ